MRGISHAEVHWGPFIDYRVYQAGAAAWAHGEDLYDRYFDIGVMDLPFTYPPFAALVFQPFTLLPLLPGALLLTAVSVALLWYVISRCVEAATAHLPGLPAIAPGWVFVAVGVSLVCEPVRQTLYYGQINIVLMGLVVADLLGGRSDTRSGSQPGTQPASRRRWLPQGVLIGVAAAIKLTPAVFVLYLLVRRRWSGAGWAVGTALGCTGLAAALRPSLSVHYWSATLRETDRIGDPGYASNQSIQGFLARAGMPENTQSAVWMCACVVAVAGIAWAVHRVSAQPGGAPAGVMLTSFIALLCSPVSWSHHWVWWVPLSVLTALSALHAPDRRDRLTAGCLAAVTAATAIIGAHGWLPYGEGREESWALWQWLPGNSYLILAVCIIVVAAWRPSVYTVASPRV